MHRRWVRITPYAIADIITIQRRASIIPEQLYQNLTQQSIFHSGNIGGEKMMKFDRDNVIELKDFLYNSCVHDAKIENVGYQCGKNEIQIELFNPIFNVKMTMVFQNVEIVLAVKGKSYGDSQTIISLTVEEDFSYLKTYLQKYSEDVEFSLYLLFQMFSGNELHIVSKEVFVETTG